MTDVLAKKWKTSFRVGLYTCEMTYTDRGGLGAVWRPKLPPPTLFSKQMLSEYQAGRNALLAEIAKDLKGAVVVFE